jgi:hypothetical protein
MSCFVDVESVWWDILQQGTVHADSCEAHVIMWRKRLVDDRCVDQVAMEFEALWASQEEGARIGGGRAKGHQAVGENLWIDVPQLAR